MPDRSSTRLRVLQEKLENLIDNYEAQKSLSTNNAKAIPENATIREEYIKCGKMFCYREHGPYYYAYWKDNKTGKLKKKYIGKYYK